MAIAVLLLLGVLWAAVLIPPVLRSRSQSRRGDALGRPGLGFGALHRNPLSRSRANDVSPSMGFRGAGSPRPLGPSRISRSTPPLLPAAGASTMTPAQRRRRDVLLVLLGAAVLTFLVAFLAGSMVFWGVQLLADVAFGGYVFLLVQMKQRSSTHPSPVARRAPMRDGDRSGAAVLPMGPLPEPVQMPARRVDPGTYGRYYGDGDDHPSAFGDHEVEPERHAVSL